MDDVPYPIMRRFITNNQALREFSAEFFGTFVLILIGNAAFAQTVLHNGRIDDVFAVVYAWGVAVMLGVAVSGGISGGHINPAVSLALATLGKLSWRKVWYYMIAQHLGAFVASGVLYVNYYDLLNHIDINRTEITSLIWATYPNENVSILNCFIDQIVGTGLLMFTAMAIIDKKNMNLPSFTHPLFLGFMVSALAMCFGLNCMAPLNPARDFATRVFTAVAGYGLDVFTYRHYWWVGFIGPHAGAIVGGWLYYIFIELQIPAVREEERHHPERIELMNSNDRKIVA